MIPSRGSAASIAAAVLLPTLRLASCDFVPYGYQTDSTHSWEYRQKNDNGGTIPSDPSSFVGSVHYDPLHHALYVTGGTFASQVLDGVDVYEVGVEETEKKDADKTNDRYWWDEAGSGLSPHLGDVGVPGWNPAMGDCFYAVFGLPTTEDGANSPDGSDAGKVKLVHSRRFGGDGSREACSAVDVVFASGGSEDAGGYSHDFLDSTSTSGGTSPASTPAEIEELTLSPSSGQYTEGTQGVPTLAKEDMAGSGSDGEKPEISKYLLGEANPTTAPTTGTISPAPSSSTYEPTITAYPTFATDFPTTDPPVANFAEGSQGVPTLAKEDMAGSNPRGGVDEKPETSNYFLDGANPTPAPTTGTISPAPSSSTYEPTITAFPTTDPPVETPRRGLGSPGHDEEAAGDNSSLRQRGLESKIATRSVRLLMAGHVESQNYEEGYLVSELPKGMYNEASVYAFAQQVDVRLPAGDGDASEVQSDLVAYQAGNTEDLDYDLHVLATEEEELAQDLEMNWKEDHPQSEFERIVTSGVESRALLNDMLPSDMMSVYPVSLVADPVSKSHYYVAMLASNDGELNEKSPWYGGDPGDEEDGGMEPTGVNVDPTIGEGASARSYTDYDSSDDQLIVDGAADRFGLHGRPDYGSDYRIILKKMSVETVPATDQGGLDDSELILAGKSTKNETVVMRHQWMEEFSPEGGEDARPSGLLYAPGGGAGGKDDVLVMVGTTNGRGSAFGTSDNFAASFSDLDGFVTKVRTDTGAFAGGEKFNSVSGSFVNTHSERIASNPGQDEIVTGVCAKPLRTVGDQDKTEHVYVVGGTSAKLAAIPPGTRDREFESSFGKTEDGLKVFEAFLMKIDLDTMNVVWTVQVGAVPSPSLPKNSSRRTAFGYGCAVTSDGQDVYLTGIIRDGGVATDFSAADSSGLPYKASGGTDVFVSSYKTADGSRNFLQQFGSEQDDAPSRGNGGLTTDRHGNAVLSGSTRGSLLRRRGRDEFRYGSGSREAAADVFVMSLERGTGRHVSIGGTDYKAPPPPVPAGYGSPVTPLGTPPTVVGPAPSPAAASSSQESSKGVGGVIGLSILLALVTGALSSFAVYRIRRRRDAENKALMGSGGNLHNQRETNLQARRRSTWGLRNKRNKRSSSSSSGLPGIGEMNVMVEVRNSASGGWHGIYDDEQLQAIDFGVPTGGEVDVVEQSLFMEESGLQEIEESLGQYQIGEMDDVSDEDLIKAYEEAMAIGEKYLDESASSLGQMGDPFLTPSFPPPLMQILNLRTQTSSLQWQDWDRIRSICQVYHRRTLNLFKQRGKTSQLKIIENCYLSISCLH